MDNLNKEYRLGLYEKSMPSTLTWVEKLTIAKKRLDLLFGNQY